MQTAVKTDFFPNQLTVMPRHGDKVTVGGSELTWHAVDTIEYNVNLYHFAYALGKPTSNVLFWAVTVVNSLARSQTSASQLDPMRPLCGGSTARK